MNDDKRCCKNCRAGGYVLSLDKVSCSHSEFYHDPDYVCNLHRKRGIPDYVSDLHRKKGNEGVVIK